MYIDGTYLNVSNYNRGNTYESFQVKKKQTSRRAAVNKNSPERYMLLLLPLVVLSILMILYCNTVTATNKIQSDQKYFKSILIEKGDSLWSIAQSNISSEWKSVEAYIDEIMELNKLSSDIIHEGNYISIPYYMTE